MTRPIGYYDVETYEWSTYVVGGYLPPGAAEPTLVWQDAGALVEALVSHEGVEWRAHYAGRFDALLIATVLAERRWKLSVTLRGASVLVLSATRPGARRVTATFVDVFALAPVGLAKLARAAGLTQKSEWDHRRTRPGWDGTCADSRELAEYLRRDILALRDGDAAWRRVVREVAGVEPSRTLGATAWRSATQHLGELPEDVDVRLPLDDYRDGREGYYGGRVEVLRSRAPAVWRYDRNSSYPAALVRQPVPVGRRRWSRRWSGEPGTVWARVTVPESRHPPLPLRIGGRLVFPHGTFEGAWTSVELTHALAHGARIERVLTARLASETTDALGAWCQRVWEARQSRPEWGGLLKLLANSLTGKLAQRPERSTVGYRHRDTLPAGAELLTRSTDPNAYVWFRTHSESVAPCARPEWAAFLTAEARTELHSQLLHAGDGSAYCDTDSVYSTAPLTRALGAGLGQWKAEGVGDSWSARAPKVYRYDTGNRTHVRAKGFSRLTPEGYESLEAGLPWASTEGVETLLTTVRGGQVAFRRLDSTRRLSPESDWIGGRLRLTCGDTRAPSYEEAFDEFG